MEATRHYLASQGWTAREELIFIDDGYSGGSLDRPALTKLRKFVQAGEVDCVVVFKIDRLSRSVIDTVTLVLQEWEDLTFLKSAREPVDTTSAMGKQFFYMLVSYAEWERNVIRERMFSGKMRRAKDGRSPGFPTAYGYKKGPTAGTMVLVDEEVHVVRMVYDLAEQGQTVRFITKCLNEKAFKSRKGAPWGTSMVSKMLHNPIYLGKLVWGRTRLNPRWKKSPSETRVKQAEPYVDMETDNIPPIISQEQFDRVQRLMAGNQKIQAAAIGSDHLLTGLIKCARCGRAMQYNAYEKWAYYRCGQKSGQGLCDAPSLRAEGLEEEVIAVLRQRFEDLAGDLISSTADSGREAGQLVADLAALETHVARLETQEKRINQDYRSENLTAEERRQLLAEVQAERSQLLRAMADMKDQQGALDDSRLFLQEQMAHIRDSDLFRALPPEKQKHILRFFIKEIRALKTSGGDVDVTIAWKGIA
jgi:site-specific DNA recombinase